LDKKDIILSEVALKPLVPVLFWLKTNREERRGETNGRMEEWNLGVTWVEPNRLNEHNELNELSLTH
jgi:hypothetical protein